MVDPNSCSGTLPYTIYLLYQAANPLCTGADPFFFTGSSLEQQPFHALDTLLNHLIDNGQYEAVMVMDAMSVTSGGGISKKTKAAWIKLHAKLEVNFCPRKAMQSSSECFQLGGGHATDYLWYGKLLHEEEKDQLGATNAVSHAVAICEPCERFNLLVMSEMIKAEIDDGPGALRDPVEEADTLGQLEFDHLKQLAEMRSTAGDVTTAVATYDRGAAMERSIARIKQPGASKNTLGDHAGAIADLDAAIQLGLDNALTYMHRGDTKMHLGQFSASLADLDRTVAKQPHCHHYRACVVRVQVKYRMCDPQDAVADMDAAHEIHPLSHPH